MYGTMQPYVDQLLRRKDENEPTDEERLRAMEAKDIAHRAIEKIAADAERRGLGGQLRGRKPPEPHPEEEAQPPREEPPTQTHVSPEPITPPPPDAVGRLRRTGSNLDWDVRALDPKIRSATEHSDGRLEIVINNQFPVYKQRNGDLVYMLETGLLEELKPSGDEEDKTVPEYYEQVTEALYLAAQEAAPSARLSR
jgi:hypothetical protein